MDAPIPPPLPDDDEDVGWALSTASALWGRGEQVEALRWLRKAAESASDADADSRALHLFKAAADLNAQMGSPSTSKPPSVPAQPIQPTPAKLPVAPARGSEPRTPSPPAAANAPASTPAARTSLPTATGIGPVRYTSARTVPSAHLDAARIAAVSSRIPTKADAPNPLASSSKLNQGPRSVPEARKSEPRPASRPRRPSESGRRRAVDASADITSRGEGADAGARPIASEAAPSRVRFTPKSSRAFPDDEVTEQRSSAALLEALSSRTNPQSPRYDDLDEVTRVIREEKNDDDSLDSELEAAIARGGAPARDLDIVVPGPVTDVRAPAGLDALRAEYDGPIVSEVSSEATPVFTAAGVTGLMAPAPSVAVPSTERAMPLPSLNALRVAVMPGEAPGEARFIALDGVTTPPAGAIQAIIVPLTVTEGELLARLLGRG